MANTAITYPAQRLNIKALRGNYFKLVVNIKDSDGSDYDFTTGGGASGSGIQTLTDKAYFTVFGKTGAVIRNFYYANPESEEATTETITFRATVEDGKITIEAFGPSGFWPGRGTYKYVLFTQLNDQDGTPPQGEADAQMTYWLYGDFIVVDENPYSAFGGLPTGDTTGAVTEVTNPWNTSDTGEDQTSTLTGLTTEG